MPDIEALQAFNHLGQRVTITEDNGTTITGTLDAIRATHRRTVAEVYLEIGGHDVYVNSKWTVTVE
jgi:hypothetical protein